MCENCISDHEKLVFQFSSVLIKNRGSGSGSENRSTPTELPAIVMFCLSPFTRYLILFAGGVVGRNYRRCNSTLAMELKKLTAEAAFSRPPVFRTSESDPTKHTSSHIGLFYTIPPEDAERWISRGLSKRAYRSHRAFSETSLMVRAPGVELISCLHAADYTVPNVRYIIYGRPGCGKSTTLAYVIHYCGRAGWFVAHEPWLPYHLRYSRNVEPSSFQPGLLDHPAYAINWLKNFHKMNELLLSPSDGSSPPVTLHR